MIRKIGNLQDMYNVHTTTASLSFDTSGAPRPLEKNILENGPDLLVNT